MEQIKLADLYKLIDVLEKTKEKSPEKAEKIIKLLELITENISENSIKIMNKDEIVSLFERKFGTEEDLKDIDFNDEIVEIEEIEERETIDIEVDGNHLYYANDILTHNSAYNNLDAGVESISDSIGVIMTADIALVLITNEQLREQKQVMIKSEKNRYTGKLDKVILEVNWAKMQFKSIVENKDIVEELNNSFKDLSPVNNVIEKTYDNTTDSSTENEKTEENTSISFNISDDEFEFD